MKSFWVSVSYDENVVINSCFTVGSREEAVTRMMDYLALEFDLPQHTRYNVNHH